MVVILYLVWFMVVIVCLVWFMVVMVILSRSSSKQAWPALGGSTKEQSKNLIIWELKFGCKEQKPSNIRVSLEYSKDQYKEQKSVKMGVINRFTDL